MITETLQKKMTAVEKLRLKFPGEASLLFKDLSFSVQLGEKVLLLGASGSGKSTLLQVLTGLIPHSIEIPLTYDKIEIPDAWAFVFQDPDTQFCMPYVHEELAFVLENLNVPRSEMDEKIKAILKEVGLDHIDPHTSIDHLSQGMKQRLALASALLLQPDVLFLDEPTALLDPEGTEQIWQVVKEVTADKTVIIVEHKIDHIIDWVDRVILFNKEGKIIANDEPKHVFTKNKEEIIEYGIWYPDVWKDYVGGESYRKILHERARKEQATQKPILAIQNFKGYYGNQQRIEIEEAKVYPKEWITIIGDNGAGKTTFLLSLVHLLKTEGTYLLNNRRIDLSEKNIEQPEELGFVFQNPELQFITNSILDEIAFSYEQAGLSFEQYKGDVESLLKDFDLQMDASRHPYQLSIGQKRRLSVATALTKEPMILLLDEPTFGQDAKNTFSMLEKLEALRKKGTTILMVTHDLNIVEHFATEIWTIHEGRLVKKEKVKQKGFVNDD